MKIAIAREGNQEVKKQFFAVFKDFRPVMVQTWNKTVESLSINKFSARLDSRDSKDSKLLRRNMLKECSVFFVIVCVTNIKKLGLGKMLYSLNQMFS